MQNNVKSSLKALVSALLVFLLLFGVFLLTGDDADPAVAVYEVAPAKILFSEENGVRYVGDGFTVSDYTKEVERGGKAKVSVSAEDGTELSISVYYASGKSKSKAFEPRTAVNGEAVWEWTFPKNSSASEIRVVIRSADTYATLTVAVV